MLGYKTSLNKSNKIEIIGSILSDHNTMELEVIREETLEIIQLHRD
jgi:hypothetical protein